MRQLQIILCSSISASNPGGTEQGGPSTVYLPFFQSPLRFFGVKQQRWEQQAWWEAEREELSLSGHCIPGLLSGAKLSQADLPGNFPALCQHLQESEGGDLSFLQGVPPSQHQLDNLPISLSPGITLECFKKQVGCVTPGKPELLPSAVPSAGISAAMGRTRASSWCKRASAESS